MGGAQGLARDFATQPPLPSDSMCAQTVVHTVSVSRHRSSRMLETLCALSALFGAFNGTQWLAAFLISVFGFFRALQPCNVPSRLSAMYRLLHSVSAFSTVVECIKCSVRHSSGRVVQ